MRAPIRVVDVEKSRIIWSENGSADHYRFSDVYNRVAFDMMNMNGTFG